MNSDPGAARDKLLEANQQFVRGVAAMLVKRLSLPRELYDECVAAGYLGLVEAAERFDFHGNSKFQTYAYLRVRGAMIDALRNSSELSNRAYRYTKALQAAQELREAELKAEGSEQSVPASKAAQLAKVLDYAAKGALAFRMSLADLPEEGKDLPGSELTPEEIVIRRQERAFFAGMTSRLPDNERFVIEKYYFENLTFARIGKLMDGASKSWVSRLHSRALERLKAFLLEEGKGSGAKRI